MHWHAYPSLVIMPELWSTKLSQIAPQNDLTWANCWHWQIDGKHYMCIYRCEKFGLIDETDKNKKNGENHVRKQDGNATTKG